MHKHRRKPRQPNGHANGHGTHDRRSFYRADELAHAQIVTVEIPDPYGTPSDAEARLEPGRRRNGTAATREPERRAPEAPGPRCGAQSARRHYQSLHETAFASALCSCDLTRPVIDKVRGDRQGPRPFLQAAVMVAAVGKGAR